jgi:hypothetical protein
MRNALRTLVLAAAVLFFAKPVMADEPVVCKAQGDPMYEGLSDHGISSESVGKQECFEYTATTKGWPYGHNFQHYGPTQAEADQRVRNGMCQVVGKDSKKFFRRVSRKDDRTVICKAD